MSENTVKRLIVLAVIVVVVILVIIISGVFSNTWRLMRRRSCRRLVSATFICW